MILPSTLNHASFSGAPSGGGLTEAQAEMLQDLWNLRGFNPEVTPVITDSQINVGTKTINIDNSDPNQTVLEIQP